MYIKSILIHRIILINIFSLTTHYTHFRGNVRPFYSNRYWIKDLFCWFSQAFHSELIAERYFYQNAMKILFSMQIGVK